MAGNLFSICSSWWHCDETFLEVDRFYIYIETWYKTEVKGGAYPVTLHLFLPCTCWSHSSRVVSSQEIKTSHSTWFKRGSGWRKLSLTLRLADVLRETDSQPVIRAGNMGTTSNSEVTGVALNNTANKNNGICTVNCLGPTLILPSRWQFDKRLLRFYFIHVPR